MRDFTILACITVCCFFLASPSASAQNYPIGQPVPPTCSGTFLPPAFDQPLQPSYTSTICPAQMGWERVQLQFTDLLLEAGDELRFFDGNTPDAPELTPTYGIHSGLALDIKASAANTSGCLRVVFVPADPNTLATRWQATITCVPPCQRIENTIVPVSDYLPGEPLYLHLCQADTLRLSCLPAFPQNGTIYPQSLASSSFTWRINGAAVGQSDQLVLPFQRPPGIYALTLDVTTRDALGCTQTDYLPLRVTVSEPVPLTEIPFTGGLCVGDTLTLYTSREDVGQEAPGYVIADAPALPFRLQQTLLQNGIVHIPASGMMEIESKIRIDNAPGVVTLTPDGLFQGIAMNIEHTYVGDLRIRLTCPSGQSTDVLAFPNGLGGIDFGEPLVAGTTAGGVENLCAGVGYNYRFLPDAVNGTLIDFLPNAPSHTYTTQPCELDNNTYTYSGAYFPEGDYRAQFAFNELLGCPIEGEWTLSIRDNLDADNGFLFFWNILLDEESPELAPLPVAVTEWAWQHPDIIRQDADSVQIRVTTPGPQQVPFVVRDELGCETVATYTFDVRPDDHPDCLVVGTEQPISDDGAWNVWPNPSYQSFFLQAATPASTYQYEVLDTRGARILVGEASGDATLDASAWPSGIYLLRIQDASSGTTAVRKLLRH